MANGDEVVGANSDIIFGSSCGKKFRPEKVIQRDAWSAINAVKNNQLFEIKSPIILQPGPAALGDGVQEIAAHIQRRGASGCRDGLSQNDHWIVI